MRGKLFDVIRDIPPTEREAEIAAVMSRLNLIANRPSVDVTRLYAGGYSPREWLALQIAIFHAYGKIDDAIATDLERVFEPLLDDLGPIEHGVGRIPFVLVEKSVRGLHEQLYMIECPNGRHGKNDLFAEVNNLVVVPASHYLAVDVEDGRADVEARPGESLENRHQHLVDSGRSALVMNEGVNMVIPLHEVLVDHGVYCTGSSVGGGDTVPGILAGYWTTYVERNKPLPWSYAASCARRIAAS